MANEPVVRARDVYVGYSDVAVICGVSLHVDAGEVVALLGPNGAGKSTLLRALSGAMPAASGDIEVLGRPVAGDSAHRIARRGLAHVPDHRGLFADLTVEENLRLGLRGARRERQRAREATYSLFPELRGMGGRRAGALSGGEQQMLALGRAFATQPRCMLVDELSLGLAPIIVERLLPVIRRIATEQGVGVLLVEQHVPMALTVADRAYVLARGQVQLEGAAADLAHARDRLRAAYLGDDNV